MEHDLSARKRTRQLDVYKRQVVQLCRDASSDLPVLVDIVGKGEAPEAQAEALTKNGMRAYAHFSRWSCSKVNRLNLDYGDNNCFFPAEEADAEIL